MNAPLPHLTRKGPPKPSDVLSRIGGQAEPHEMRDPFDIGEALLTLSLSGEAVTVLPAGVVEPLLARIASVDPELPHFVLDFTGSALPPAGKATLVAALGGNAKLQFEIEQKFKALPGEPMHVAAEFPPACLVLNRRAARRVETPVGVNYTAVFRTNGRQFDLPLYDFSETGVGLRATPTQVFGLHVGKKLEGVRLELGPNLTLTADLEVRLMRPFRTFLLGEQVQIGCSFSSISLQMKQTLERFVTSGAVERRAAAR
ncbi:flagellar brake protein [Massilia sp. H6]|uniref:flagellar brake protein n=1 Tax=Massilia sp. H6 TaxID=2970464 RepID=UPI002167AFFA|nr:PilZ domain-containing protein [Massilia sp. H6]UVW27479.1 PilZ domain-containing protein [Massilia sp. H6]